MEQLKHIRDCIAAERDLRLRGGRPVRPASQPAVASASAPESCAAASSPPAVPSTQQPSSLVDTLTASALFLTVKRVHSSLIFFGFHYQTEIFICSYNHEQLFNFRNTLLMQNEMLLKLVLILIQI